jgi:hypothetical protein
MKGMLAGPVTVLDLSFPRDEVVVEKKLVSRPFRSTNYYPWGSMLAIPLSPVTIG